MNAAPTPASVAARASCAIDGVGEAVPLDILPDATRATIVGQAQQDYRLGSFLQKAGAAPPDEGEAAEPKAVVVAARCRRMLPAGGRVALVWGAGIATADGLATLRPHRLDFKVRPAFTARFECSRANPAAACSPIEPLTLRFTGQVPAALAQGVRLVDSAGRVLPAEPFKPHAQTVDTVTFKGPFAERTHFKVEVPAKLTDDAGRPLTNAVRFPLDVATADAPPLVKFAATFGIVEAAEGGVLPVTVRAVEATIGGRDNGPIGGRDVVVATDAGVAEWLRTLDTAEERTQDEEPIAGSDDKKYIETTRSTPLLRPDAPTRSFAISRKDPRAFEVVGIPLKGRGFHVVELASPRAGRGAARARRDALRRRRRARHRPGGPLPVGPRAEPRVGDAACRRGAGGGRADRGQRQLYGEALRAGDDRREWPGVPRRRPAAAGRLRQLQVRRCAADGQRADGGRL